MKLLDITEFYSERGGGIRSHLTIRGQVLCQLGHDHAVIAPGPQDDGVLLPEQSRARGMPEANPTTTQAMGRTRVFRVRGPALPYDRTYHLLGRFDKIAGLVRAARPDVLEAHSPYLAMGAVVACGRDAARVRTAFWHADHLSAYVEPALASVVGKPRAEAMVKRLWKGVRVLLAPFDATFVASVSQARKLTGAGVRGVVHVPFGVDGGTFHPGARNQRRREELVQGTDAALLIGIGRFAVEKRWDIVLDAFANIRSRRPAFLMLLGDGPERERLQKLAPPGVFFPGFEKDRSQLAATLASADLLVHACPCETSGLAIAEAVACGVPVVVPDSGGAAESADPTCSQTYPSLDAAACADAIERLLAGRSTELKSRALAAAARVPTVQRHFTRVLSVYEDLLKERGAARGPC